MSLSQPAVLGSVLRAWALPAGKASAGLAQVKPALATRVDSGAAPRELVPGGDPFLQLFDRKLDRVGILAGGLADLSLLLGSQLDPNRVLGAIHYYLRYVAHTMLR